MTFSRHFVGDIDHALVPAGAPLSVLRTLDPAAEFLPAAPAREDMGSVGLRLAAEGETIEITGVIAGSPAARAGLLAGERILSVDGESVESAQVTEAVRRLRGAVNTVVRVGVGRDCGAREIELVREHVSAPPLVLDTLPGGIAYVAIPGFQETTGEEFARIVADLHDESAVHGVLLDLRDNSGGLLRSAVAVADELLPEGLVVSLEGREGTMPIEYRARPGARVGGLSVLVLVNRRTASAAEVLAAALQEHRRALIVGQRTLGKGTVQTVFPLEAGGALKLTTHRYRTPRGRLLDQIGVSPDHLLPRCNLPSCGVDQWRSLAEQILRSEIRGTAREANP